MLKTFNSLRYSASTRTSLVIWALTMISLPILGWILGEGFLQRGMSVGVLMQVIGTPRAFTTQIAAEAYAKTLPPGPLA